MQWIFFAMFAIVAITLSILQYQRRERRIRAIAQAHGLSFIGTALPRSFPFDQTSVRRASQIRNVVVGDLGATAFVIFDCEFGGGKHRSFQTVVAALGPEECFGYQRYDSTLTRESVDGWTMMFRKKELLLPEEIETLLPTK
jgi:hypothetical protein